MPDKSVGVVPRFLQHGSAGRRFRIVTVVFARDSIREEDPPTSRSRNTDLKNHASGEGALPSHALGKGCGYACDLSAKTLEPKPLETLHH